MQMLPASTRGSVYERASSRSNSSNESSIFSAGRLIVLELFSTEELSLSSDFAASAHKYARDFSFLLFLRKF